MNVLATMGKLYTVRSLESKNWSTLEVNFKVIVKTCKYPQKNWKSRFSNERISNYVSILYYMIQIVWDAKNALISLRGRPPREIQVQTPWLHSDFPIRQFINSQRTNKRASKYAYFHRKSKKIKKLKVTIWEFIYFSTIMFYLKCKCNYKDTGLVFNNGLIYINLA